jgi:hypothetical protein
MEIVRTYAVPVAISEGRLPELSAGDPGRIRTCDLQLRRLLLYPLSYGAPMPPTSDGAAFI